MAATTIPISSQTCVTVVNLIFVLKCPKEVESQEEEEEEEEEVEEEEKVEEDGAHDSDDDDSISSQGSLASSHKVTFSLFLFVHF